MASTPAGNKALYGTLDPTTLEWTDGIFTKVLREVSGSHKEHSRRWLIPGGRNFCSGACFSCTYVVYLFVSTLSGFSPTFDDDSDSSFEAIVGHSMATTFMYGCICVCRC